MLRDTRTASAACGDSRSGRPCAHSRTKAIRLLITRGRRALANLSVRRKCASARCDNRKAGSFLSPADSMQSMSSGGGSATSARINPALRRIFFVPALFRPRLARPGAVPPPPSFRTNRYSASSSSLPFSPFPGRSFFFPAFTWGLPRIKILQRAH